MVSSFGNVTANQTSGWQPEPDFRGTWTILSSCIITISLCVWTAVHLNLPEHRKLSQHFWRKLKWLVLGLAAPEIVAYVAWHQRREASKVLRDVQKHLGQSSPGSRFARGISAVASAFGVQTIPKVKADSSPSSLPSSPIERPRYTSSWSMVHGFYLIMGGFALDSNKSDDFFLPGCRTRAVLTPAGFQFLLDHEPSCMPDISEDQIKDKSKADGLKKTLVCAQALWFCIQCAGRLAGSLPVSLLELNTVGHAICTLLIYFLWWDKPLEVEEPTLIQDEKLKPLFAYMWMSSRISAVGYADYDITEGARDEFDCIWPYRHPNPIELEFSSRPSTSQSNKGDVHQPDVLQQEQAPTGSQDNAAQQDQVPAVSSSFSQTTSPGISHKAIGSLETLSRQEQASVLPSLVRQASSPGTDHTSFVPYDYSGRRNEAATRWFWIANWMIHKGHFSRSPTRTPAGLGKRNTAISHLSPTDLVRWSLAAQAIKKYDLDADLRTRHASRTDGRDLVPRLKVRIENIHSDNVSFNELWVGFTVAGAIYGGLHMLAWNTLFASTLERDFWRIASCSVTITGILVGPFVPWLQSQTMSRGSATFNAVLNGVEYNRGVGFVRVWGEMGLAAVTLLLVFTLGPVLWFLYIGSRVYLVVECFKNVSHLPRGAFQDVSWAPYIPHIS